MKESLLPFKEKKTKLEKLNPVMNAVCLLKTLTI